MRKTQICSVYLISPPKRIAKVRPREEAGLNGELVITPLASVKHTTAT